MPDVLLCSARFCENEALKKLIKVLEKVPLTFLEFKSHPLKSIRAPMDVSLFMDTQLGSEKSALCCSVLLK